MNQLGAVVSLIGGICLGCVFLHPPFLMGMDLGEPAPDCRVERV